MREVRTVCPMIIIYSLGASSFKDFNDPPRPPGLHSQGDGRTGGSSSSSSVFVSLRARCVCVIVCVCVSVVRTHARVDERGVSSRDAHGGAA